MRRFGSILMALGAVVGVGTGVAVLTGVDVPGRSPIVSAVPSPLDRRMMGALIGLTLIAIVHSPWGRRSGAPMNPVLTLTFHRLGRSARRDAAAYVAAQFVGGALGVVVAAAFVGNALAAPGVMYVVTEPGTLGVAVAFVSELVISAIMMTMVLRTSSSSGGSDTRDCSRASSSPRTSRSRLRSSSSSAFHGSPRVLVPGSPTRAKPHSPSPRRHTQRDGPGHTARLVLVRPAAERHS